MSASAAPAAAVPTTENCRFCWMCRQACPVGHVTARETHTPHAWALTIESVKRGQLQWNAETVGVLYACADCGLCQSHCATDQPLPDAIVRARAEVVAAGKAPAAVHALDEKLRRVAVPAAAPHATKSAVALYIGDGVGQATLRAATHLLTAAGHPVHPIAPGRPSGAIASSLGLHDTAVTLARAVLADVEASGATEVLVLTPADRWAFEHVYPTRLGLTWPAGVLVNEVTVRLAEALAAGRLRLRADTGTTAYAYHDPCHSPRIGRDSAAPRALLAAALGSSTARPLFWREGRAHPCGATSGLDLTHPEIASRLAQARFDDAHAAGAKVLVTEDPACLHHLGAHGQHGVDVRGLYELLAPLV